MKKGMRILTMLLVAALFMTLVPADGMAANAACDYIEVVTENAPLRREASQNGKIMKRFDKGIILKTSGWCLNAKLHKWFKVEFEGETCFIFSGNVCFHSHSYLKLKTAETTLGLCSCGELVEFQHHKTHLLKTGGGIGFIGLEMTIARAYAADFVPVNSLAESVTVAGEWANMDAGLPFADIVGVGIIILALAAELMDALPEMDTYVQVLEHIDYQEFIDRESVCSPESYRLVLPFTSKEALSVTQKCYDMTAALLLVISGQNVYTRMPDKAYELAALFSTFGSYQFESAHGPGMYDHIHLFEDETFKISNHIFYGAASGTNELPIGF